MRPKMQFRKVNSCRIIWQRIKILLELKFYFNWSKKSYVTNLWRHSLVTRGCSSNANKDELGILATKFAPRFMLILATAANANVLDTININRQTEWSTSMPSWYERKRSWKIWRHALGNTKENKRDSLIIIGHRRWLVVGNRRQYCQWAIRWLVRIIWATLLMLVNLLF